MSQKYFGLTRKEENKLRTLSFFNIYEGQSISFLDQYEAEGIKLDIRKFALVL